MNYSITVKEVKKIKFKLIHKIICVFAAVFIIFFLLTGIIAQKTLEHQVNVNAEEYVATLINDEGIDIDNYFKKLEALGQRSVNFIKKTLKHEPTPVELQEFDKKYRYINGALRSNLTAFHDEDISGVFLSNHTDLNYEIKKIIIATEGTFDDYARGVSGTVFNMYIITRQQLIRIYKKDWAFAVEPDHDFSKDFFYFIADPEHNPERKSRWTDPYYDSIWKHWMTSLITPIYTGNDFWGIVGHDVILDDVYRQVLKKKYFNTGYGFIFDSKKNIVIHPHHLNKLFETAEMGTKLTFSDIGDQALTGAISKAVENINTTGEILEIDFSRDGKEFHLQTYKLDFLDWYFGIVVPSEEVIKMLPQFRKQFLIGGIVLSIIIFSVVVLLVYCYVISPIINLTKVAREIRSGNFNKKAEVKGHDEIGELATAFNDMTDKLNKSFKNLQKENAERRIAEEALKESENRFRALVENTSDWVWELDENGMFTYASHKVKDLLGFKTEELIGRTPFDFMPPEEKKRISGILQPIIEGRKPFEKLEHKCLQKNGNLIMVETTGIPIFDKEGKYLGYRGIAKDITAYKKSEEEKERLQAQLLIAQKMEAIGTLAGGVAHDLNNTLGAIVGYPDLLLDEIPQDSSIRSSIMAIKQSGERAAAIVQDLLTLARRGVNTTEVVNLNDIVSKYFETPEYKKLKEFNPDVDVETSLIPDLFNIIGSPVHLSKTVMNLVANSAEAMPGGGKIVISTQNRYLDKPVKGYNRVNEGEYVVLTVSDNGTGISKQDLGKIFEPFYTKKVMGRSGTGLGMAVVWGTVKDHQGYVDVKSEEGEGTTFELCFPITKKDIDKTEEPVAAQDYSGNGEKILIVDDMEAQREIASSILTKLNYDVHTVSSGEEAVEYVKTSTVDLLILDMIMDPGIDGLETYKRILEIHPNQKAIIASGFSETGRVIEAEKLGAGKYIKKPYTREKIGLAVKFELEKQTES